MDIATLEALGINKEDLVERIIDQAVNSLLSSTGFNHESEEEVSYESRFKKEVEKRVQASVDAKIAALAELHVLPRVGEMIEAANMVKTNQWGESKSPPMSFKEYIAHRAEAYMAEDVDYYAKSKADYEAKGESTYNYKSSGQRLTVLMKKYIQETLEKHAAAAVTDVNKVIADNITKAAKDAISSVSANLKIAVTV